MKLGWQLKEEAPLFIVVLVIVAALMKYSAGYAWELSFGTGFLIAAVITSLEVIFDAMKEKKKKKK